MKKAFLYILLLTFMACKTEVNVEEETNYKSLEEVWSMDIPRIMKESSVDFHFMNENNLFFLNQGEKAELHQIDLTTRELKSLKLDLESVFIHSLYSHNINSINSHKNDIYFITRGNRLLRYDTKKQEFESISDYAPSFRFSEDDKLMYLVKQTSFNSDYELGILNLSDKSYERIVKLNINASYDTKLHLFYDDKMNQYVFINSYQENCLIDVKNKKIINENYPKDLVNNNFLCQFPFAYSTNGRFYKVDMRDGSIQWERNNEKLNVYSDKIIIDEANKWLFISNNFDKLSCIDTQNGQILWTKKLNVLPNNEYKPSDKNELELLNGLLYVSNGEKLLVFDEKTGEELLRQTKNYSIGSPMFIDNNNKLIYTFKDGKLCALKGLK